jgi:hypothetical protein
MAKPIKENIPQKKRGTGLLARFTLLVSYFRRRLLLAFGIILGTLIILVGVFTTTFRVADVTVSRDAQSGCLSDEYVKQYILTEHSFIWSAIFFHDDQLRNMHPCLESLSVHWNPFSLKTVGVEVHARKPVLKVIVRSVRSNAESLGTDSIFFAPVVSEEGWFMLNNGTLVQLDAEPQIPTIWLLHDSQRPVQSVSFTEERVTYLLQIIHFCESDFSFSPQLVVNDYGVVRFSAPFSQNIFLTLRSDLRMQLGSLQSVLRASTIDRSKLYSIDVRSGNALIRFLK